MTRGLFITGTNTGVGKTHVAALIARSLRQVGHRVGVYKPVASGCFERDGRLVAEDAQLLWEAAGRPGTLAEVCPQCFVAPLAPPLAAAAEGLSVDRQLLRTGIHVWQERCDIVLVEGAGGLMSPLSDTDYNADLANDLGLPLVVVAANELGTINATLQTLITAHSVIPNVRVAGVVLNQPAPLLDDRSLSSNAEEIARRTEAPLLASVGYGQQEMAETVDWLSLAGEVNR